MTLNKLKMLLSVVLALVLALTLGTAAVAKADDPALSAQERAVGQKITYTGGVVLRTNVKAEDASLLELACVLANDPYIILGQPSLWDVQIQGGTAPYTVEAAICYRSFDSTDQSDSWPVVEVFTLSDLLFEHTFTDEGRYFWQFTATDADGQSLVFQTRVFETYTEADEADSTTVAGKVNSIVSQLISDGMSDYRRALVLHDWLINNADYDTTYTYYEAAGVLLHGTGVCDSYARAYQMLLSAAGVESMIVTGQAGSDAAGWEPHGWNLVLLGDQWYHIDCTWDDPVNGKENHAYFCLSDEAISADHTWNRPGESIDHGMLVPDAQGGQYSGMIGFATDYDFSFGSIEEYTAQLDSFVAAQNYKPITALYTGDDLNAICDDLWSAVEPLLQNYMGQSLLASGSCTITTSGNYYILDLDWAAPTPYICIDETAATVTVNCTAVITPSSFGPDSGAFTWTSSDPSVAVVTGQTPDADTLYALIEGVSTGECTITVTGTNGCSDSFTVTVLPAYQVDFDVQMAEADNSSTTFTWNAVPGATEYALIAVGEAETQVASTQACSLTVSTAEISSEVCSSLYIVARRNLNGETALSYASEQLTPPEPALEIDLVLTQHYDVVYTGGTYQPVVFRLEIANYDELAARYGSLMTEFYIASDGDDTLGSYGYIFSDARTAVAQLMEQPTATGALTLTATAQFGDLCKTVEIPVTVADSSALTVSFPERVDVTAGEDFTYVLTFDGEPCPWLASNSIYFDTELVSAPDSQSPAAYEFTALETGISPLNIDVYYSNLPISARALVYIADSEGNVPVLKPEIRLNALNDEFYLNGAYSTMQVCNALLLNGNLFLNAASGITPVWTVSCDSDAFPWTLTDNGYDVSVAALTDTMTLAGSFQLTLTCTIGQEGDYLYCTDSVVIPVTVHESPVTDETALLPASFNTQVGESIRLDAAAILPSDWSGPVPELALSDCTDVFELVEAGSGVYNCVPMQPGVYNVMFRWKMSNLVHFPSVLIIVADEEGNVPGFAFTTYSNLYMDKLFVCENWRTDLVYFSVSNLNEFTSAFGAEKINFTLASDRDDSYGVYTLDAVSNDSTYIYCSTGPSAAGTVTLTLTASVGNPEDPFYHSEDFTFTFTIDELDESLYSISLPERIDGQVNQLLSLSPSVTCPEGETWRVSGASLDGSRVLDYAGTSADQTAYNFNPIASGIARPGVYVRVRNYTLFASTIVFVADENGNLPTLELNLTELTGSNPLYIRDSVNNNYASVLLANLAELQEIPELNYAPVWSLSVPEGAPNITATDDGAMFHLNVEDEDLTPGSWETIVNVSLGVAGSDFYLSDSVPITLVIEPDPRTETSLIPERIDVQAGDTFTINLLGRLPADWSGAAPFIQVLNNPDWIELVSTSDGVATFRVLSAGLWQLELFWQMSNLPDNFTIDVFAADENGVVPGASIDMATNVPESDFHFLGGSDYLGFFRIDNYDALSELYGGAPQWSLTVLNGPGITANDYGRRFSLELSETPTEACSVEFRVDCTWGDASWSQLCTLDISEHPDGVPATINVQDVYYLAQGDSLLLDPAQLVLPEDFDASAARAYASVSWNSGSPMDTFGESYTIEYEDNDCIRLVPQTQAICRVTIQWAYQNLSVSKEVLLYSADANGNFLSLTPQVVMDSRNDLLLEGGSFTTFPVGSATVRNWDDLSQLLGEHVNPVWTVTVSDGGPELNTELRNDSFFAFAVGNTLKAGEYDVTFSFTLDDPFLAAHCSGSVKTTMVVRENPQSDVNHAGIPASIDAQVGQPFTISKLTTMDADWDGPAPDMYISSGAENFTLIDVTDSEVTYQPLASGIYTIEIDWQLANVLASQTVTIYVADENGVIPRPEMDMNVMYDDDIVFVIGHESGNINSHRIDNYSELSSILSGKPEWTVTAVENCTDDQLTNEIFSDDTIGTWLSPHPTEPCTVRYKVTCTWDGAVWEGTSAITFAKADDLPTVVNVPDQIILSIDEPYTFAPADVLPSGWSHELLKPEAAISVGYYDSSYWQYFDSSHQNNSVTLKGSTPGIYPMMFRWVLPNYDIEKAVQVVIRNEDGTLPFPTFGIETMGTWCDFYADGNTLDLFEMSVYDYYEKESLFSGNISWSIEQTSGPAKVNASGFFAMHGPDATPPTIYTVSLDSWPTVQGVYTYRVTAKWDQCIKNVDLTVNVLPALLETPIEGIAVEDVTIKAGETISVPMEPIPLLPEGADLPIDGASNQFAMSTGFVNAFTYVGYDNGSFIYQANELGIYEYYLRRWGGNFDFRKTVTVTVTDENGDIPLPDFTLSSSAVPNLYAGGNSLDAAYVRSSDSEAMDLYDALVADEPVWTVEKLSGTTDVSLMFYTGDRCPTVQFTEEPVEGDYTFRITLTWGEKTFTTEVDVTVLPAPEVMPTGLSLPDRITLVVNETHTVSTAGAILPENGSLAGLNQFVMIFDDNDNPGHISQVYPTPANTTSFRFDKPGIYNCTWYAQVANYFLKKPVTITVTDENGEITSDKLTLTASSSDMIYAGGNELHACSAYLFDNEAKDFAATTTEKPQWSFEIISGDYDFVLFDNSEHYFCSLEFSEPPAAGSAVVRITLRWADEILMQTCSINVMPGPDSPPTGVNLPDEVTVKAGEPLVTDYSSPFLPEGWGIEGQSFFANMWEDDDKPGHMTRGDDAGENTFVYIFDEPGVYNCTWFVRCGNYIMEKPVTVKVTDENGNLPADGMVFNNFLHPRMYIEGVSRQIGNVQFDRDCYETLSSTLGGAPTYELIASSLPVNCYNFGGSACGLFLKEMPAEPCTLSYTVRVTWGDLTEDITGSTELMHVKNGMPEPLDVPDYLRLAPNEVYTFSLEEIMLPSDWSTGYGDAITLGIGATSDVWQYVDSDILSDTARTVSCRTPGIYEVDVFFEVANITVSKSVLLCIEDSDGTLWMPEGAFDLQPAEVTWYKGGNNPYLLEAVIDPGIYDLWMKLYPEGPQWFDNVVTTATGVPGHFAISLKDTDLEVGEYSLEVGFNWGDCGTAIEAWLIVEDPGVTLPEKLRLADTFELTPGQGFAIIHDELLPNGWNINGNTGLFDVIIFNEEAGIVESDSFVDGVTSFQAVKPGTCLGQVHWFCENFYIIQDFTIVVTEPVLNVAAQQTEYSLQPGMCVQTVLTGEIDLIDSAQWSTSDASVAEVDANGAITALDAGTATVTARLTGTNGASCELDFTIRVLANARQMILPAALTAIEAEAFCGTGAQVIIVPQGVKTIGNSAFATSDDLVIVRIPASVTVFGDNILANTDAAILCESGSAAEAYALANEIPVYIIK